jgi:hypothetical protein
MLQCSCFKCVYKGGGGTQSRLHVDAVDVDGALKEHAEGF